MRAIDMFIMMFVLFSAFSGARQGIISSVTPVLSAVISFVVVKTGGNGFNNIFLAGIAKIFGGYFGVEEQLNVAAHTTEEMAESMAGSGAGEFLSFIVTFLVITLALRVVINATGLFRLGDNAPLASRIMGALSRAILAVCEIWLVVAAISQIPALIPGFPDIAGNIHTGLLSKIIQTNPFT